MLRQFRRWTSDRRRAGRVGADRTACSQPYSSSDAGRRETPVARRSLPQPRSERLYPPDRFVSADADIAGATLVGDGGVDELLEQLAVVHRDGPGACVMRIPTSCSFGSTQK